ncbi:MAG: hypothetical protein JNM69_43240 [Archangium sp.]|nr:hypothetical protein [Archangium sp.]
MRWLALLVGVFLAAGCKPDCGTYRFNLPATKAKYASDPKLIPSATAIEECGDFGSQATWDAVPGTTVISFEPTTGKVAEYASMLLSVSVPTARIADGVTLQKSELSGVAFEGLGLMHTDEAVLTAGSITFHRVGELMVEEIFNRRVIELSWNLTWEGDQGVRYEAIGRDVMDFGVDK